MTRSHAIAAGVVGAIARRRGVALALVLLALGLSYAAIGKAMGLPGEPRPPIDNGITIWFPDTDPARTAYDDFQKTFGNDEAILVAFRTDEASVFEPKTLALVADIGSRVRTVPLVRGVTSLATVLCFEEGEDGTLRVERAFRDPAQAALARTRITGDPLYRGALVSQDEKTTLLTIQLERVSTQEMDRRRGKLLVDVRAALDAAMQAAGRAPGSYWWGGLGVINDELNRLSLEDLMRLGGLSYLVIVLCLWAALRRAGAVLLAATAVYVAQTCTLGLYFAAGHQLNLVTMILPTLVQVIGLTDSIYFITTWQQERDALMKEGLDKRAALARCLGFCALPGLFNSITSSVGFLAFMSADMETLRVLGVYAGAGILLAFASSVVVCTLGLERFDLRAAPEGEASGEGPIERALARLSAFTARRHGAIVLGAAVLVVVAAAGIRQLQVDTYTLGLFYDDNPVRRDNRAIEEHFGPYLPLELVIDTGKQDGVKQPAVLKGIDALEATTDGREEKVGGSTSVAGVVKRLHQVFNDGDPKAYAVPGDADAIDQELLFYDPDRDDDPLRLIDFPRWQKARVTFRTANDSAGAARDLLARVEKDAAALLPEGVKAVPSGYVPLYVKLIDYLVWGQVWSITTSFVVIFAVLLVLFRSLRYALLSLPANVIPVALTLGFMGWAGIDLDVGTVLIASVALGLAVDDTIHFVFKFRAKEQETGDAAKAVDATLRSTGAAIMATSLTLALGFSVLGLAQMKSIGLFGALMAVTMASALVGELLITPAVILTFGRGKKPAA